MSGDAHADDDEFDSGCWWDLDQLPDGLPVIDREMIKLAVPLTPDALRELINSRASERAFV